MDYTVTLHDYGKYLLTRPQADELREKIQNAVEEYDTVIVDFEGIPAVGPSFTDELFGNLVESLGRKEFLAKFKFKGLSELNRRVLRLVITNRSGKTEKLIPPVSTGT